MIPHSTTPPHRGAFVLFEGVDRCGKTTQSKLLLQRLLAAGMAAVSMRFPDRTTATGTIIDSYLKQQSNQLDDHAIHLLFSANRWESASTIANHLRSGTTVVCDRYAYSGVAFSASKVKSDTTVAAKDPVLNLEWCKAPDRGLPAPDCVIFLDLSPGEAEQRGGYGDERYEERGMQIRVREKFALLQEMDVEQGTVPWTLIDASQSIEEVASDVWETVQQSIRSSSDQPIKLMWLEGNFDQ